MSDDAKSSLVVEARWIRVMSQHPQTGQPIFDPKVHEHELIARYAADQPHWVAIRSMFVGELFTFPTGALGQLLRRDFGVVETTPIMYAYFGLLEERSLIEVAKTAPPPPARPRIVRP